MTTFEMTSFARRRHVPGFGNSYFSGDESELLALVEANFENRKPSTFGNLPIDQCCVVSVAPEGFFGSIAKVAEGMQLTSAVVRRQEGEDLFIETITNAEPEPALHVSIVLYSRQSLAAEGITINADWGVASINAGEMSDEPMHPLTMARNMLGFAGGTPTTYSAEELCQAIWHWAQRVKVTGAM